MSTDNDLGALLASDMSRTGMFPSGLLIVCVIKTIVDAANLAELPLQQTIYGAASDQCPGVCRIRLSCWMSGGKVRPEASYSCMNPLGVCCQENDPRRQLEDQADPGGPSSREVSGPVVNDPDCGRPRVARRRVVGGRAAGFGSFPWQALVKAGEARCGGALVNREHVITAAHCLRDTVARFGNTGLPWKRVTVILGEYYLDARKEPLPAQTWSVAAIFLHPDYQFAAQADRYDVAVVRLSGTVQYAAHVSSVCLPTPEQTPPPGTLAVVAGWGATIPDSVVRPRELQAAEVRVVAPQDCKRWHLRNRIRMQVFEDMLCAGHEEGGRDACQGDSGGPLVTKDFEKGRWVLIGIVSAGFSCALPGQPGLYHNISASASWISRIISS